MKLETSIVFRMSAIGTGVRKVIPLIGPASGAGSAFGYVQSVTSNINVFGELISKLYVQSDVSASHPSTPNSGGGSVALNDGYLNSSNGLLAPTVDFSQPWKIGIELTSAAETATSITSVSWSGGVATFVNPSHTLNTGDKTTVAGVSNTAYNGVYTGITRIVDNTWSGTLVANPGGAGTGGTSSRISNVISQSYSLELMG
jgi:hypothetical protein